ncbi:MAG TPA: AI-2E family transporter [Stellaceae bacterium]|nr:AI-2E family transporter [Stellaceae bacterium]
MNAAQRQAIFWIVGFAIFFLALWQIGSVLLPFAAGFAIAFFLDPLVNRLEHAGVPRSGGALIVLTLFLLVLVLVVLLIVPILQNQVLELVANLPALLDRVRGMIDTLMRQAQERLSPEDYDKLHDAVTGKLADLFSFVANVFQTALTSGVALANLLSLLFVTPVVSFFLLRDWDRIVAQVDAWVPREYLPTVRAQARLIDETLAGFLRGQLSVCLALGLYYAVTLTLIGLHFGLVVGLLIGLLAFIPYIGGGVGFVLAILLALTHFPDWQHVLYVVVIFLVGWTVEGYVLTPKLVGERVHLHPVWVIFALLAFWSLFGFLGVLVAVPVAAVIGVLVRFALARYLASPIYDPSRPRIEPEGK